MALSPSNNSNLEQLALKGLRSVSVCSSLSVAFSTKNTAPIRSRMPGPHRMNLHIETLRKRPGFKVIQGHRICHQSKGICDFLLVVNSNFGRISHGFGARATCWSQICLWDIPLCILTSSNMLMNFTLPKTRVIVLTQYRRVTDVERDGRTKML